ncbi:MAG: hypothetical protein Q8R35_01410 [bacterium]|nr:hypothetical protein [bacterium]
MWRDFIIALLGIWLFIFAFLEFESDTVDVSLTVYTGLLVFLLGIWNILATRRRMRAEWAAEARTRENFQAPPEPKYVELQSDRDARREFRGLSKEKDPTEIDA